MKYENPQDIWEGIVPCASHIHMQPDCEHCTAEMSARGARVDQIAADGAKIAASLGGPPPNSLIMEARLEVLIDSILTDPKDRMKYEGEVGRRILLVIKDVQKQQQQPVLHGINGQPLRSV